MALRDSKSASLGQLRSYSSDDDDGDDGEHAAPSNQAGKKSRWSLGSVLRTTLFTLRQHARHVSVPTTNQTYPPPTSVVATATLSAFCETSTRARWVIRRLVWFMRAIAASLGAC